MTHIKNITLHTSHTRLASYQTHHTFDGVILLFLEKKRDIGKKRQVERMEDKRGRGKGKLAGT
jgi:hypothetical protein